MSAAPAELTLRDYRTRWVSMFRKPRLASLDTSDRMPSMMRSTAISIWNHLEITRPHNLAVVGLTVLAGGIAAGSGTWQVLLPACLAAVLVAAAGNVINDCFDVCIDRVNKPRRPIPSGRLSLVDCQRYYVLLTLMALAVSALAGRLMLLVSVLWTLLLFLYSAQLKTRLLSGNLLVSSVCASGFLIGAALAGNMFAGAIPAALAFCFLMGREIVKDVEDLPGDRAAGARTLAERFGAPRALVVALMFFVLFALLAPWPYWAQLCNRNYLFVMLLGAIPLLAWASWSMMRDHSSRNLVRVSWILKVDMFVGVLGFWFGLAR